jgi:transposase
MDAEDLYSIFRRWRKGHSISSIAEATESARKTVRHYVEKFIEVGLSRQAPIAEKEQLYEEFRKILPSTERAKPAKKELQRYEEEIRGLIQDEKEPVKAKTAYEIIKTKYNLQASYESFKRFVRAKELSVKPAKRYLRIELPPGKETQIDYGRVGLFEDSHSKKNRVVWAFCTLLSCSRLPFIQFVHTQKQESFAGSFIDSLEYYRGSTEFATIDNLKSGVIKADLWDPKLNKSFAETAEYYGVFINPCRVGKGTDKGKIERIIPLARELFRMLKHIYPSADLGELNKRARKWCQEEYGQKEHGTTGIPPMQAYESVERAKLQPLPEERFEIPIWKSPKVHKGDGFFNFEGKRYAVPPAYRSCGQVWVRYTERSRLLRVFFERRLIREYVVSSKTVNYLPQDFPEGLREMMDGSYPSYLLSKARLFGADGHALIESVLKPHAYLNARRAQGMLKVMEEYHSELFFTEICRAALRRGVKLPSTFRGMLKDEKDQMALDLSLPISETGKKMLRDISYYIQSAKEDAYGTHAPPTEEPETAQDARNTAQSRNEAAGSPRE